MSESTFETSMVLLLIGSVFIAATSFEHRRNVQRQTLAHQLAIDIEPEIRELTEQYANMPIGASVSRYIRDIVTATRNHHAVDAGITARSILDLESVIRALATLYGRGFVTPELAMIATEKVFTHRLRLRDGARYESAEEIIADILRAIKPPV
ncbi:hypothetical protein SYNPS1DRAFT_21657 [Syncephalis pseudoplumigaleata]|uniref:magnesium chelatase n=1 Tax=Syncephalis pseudoplumigaleata TaxID=1712513 RepID=A0A4P9Z2J3_9FUNG|nr:hypothetical protein SYNPS1DRAFT_21657 [Syncephalis pseudoplumigaleata]|eukprot:RKP26616.1 hypothetical protein SYNPS1DRAFT_21657 [Syncephalis pseudoplumigaleata]